MNTILCIESSTDICSVCLSIDGKPVGLKESLEPKAHTRLMTILIQECMDEAQIGFDQLDAVAISAGPGSYTSLRIGASTAKAIAYAHQIPMISICTLQALSYSLPMKEGEAVLSLIDARREEVYYGFYNKDHEELSAPTPHILSETSFESHTNGYDTIYLVGNGAKKTKRWLSADKIIETDNICRAIYMTPLANTKFQSKEFEDLAYFNPNYIKGANITISKKPAF